MDRYIFGMDTLLFKLEFYVNNYAGGTYKIYKLFERDGEILIQMDIKNDFTHFGFGHVVPLDYFTQTYELYMGDELRDRAITDIYRATETEMSAIVDTVVEIAEGN
jgi:hypothetical protein